MTRSDVKQQQRQEQATARVHVPIIELPVWALVGYLALSMKAHNAPACHTDSTAGACVIPTQLACAARGCRLDDETVQRIDAWVRSIEAVRAQGSVLSHYPVSKHLLF